MPRLAGSLEALLTNLIDYAGLFPPAALPLPIVSERYGGFLASPEQWILNRLVLPMDALRRAKLPADALVSLLVESEPGPLPPQVDTLETKLPYGLSLPTYCEAPLDQITNGFAKIRTGGLTPDAIPSAAEVAEFLAHAARLRMPFKATAGLHHPLRSVRPLTYALDSPKALMHGFLNVFVAAAFAWYGAEADALAEILEERKAKAFTFGEEDLEWRGRRLTLDQIRSARRDFAHSFGSCSFEEPVAELRGLGLLP